MKMRRASLDLNYQGVNISEDIQNDLSSFAYTDNASGVADDVSITLVDNTHKWLLDWFPEKTDKVIPIIKLENWSRDGDSQSLDCGSFIIDEPGYSGPPSQLTINGNSMPSNSGFKEVKNTKAWNQINLEMIAKDIANKSGLSLFFDSSTNPYIKYVLQEKVSDSKFLLDLCNTYGFGYKVSNDSVIIYNIQEYEAKDAVATISYSGGKVLNFNLGTTLTGTAYTGAKIRYKDELTGELKPYRYNLSNPETEKILNIDEIAESYAAAESITLAKLKEVNKNEFLISFTIHGDLKILGSTCIILEGYGKFDGKYFVDQAIHTIGSGYNTSFTARKVV